MADEELDGYSTIDDLVGVLSDKEFGDGDSIAMEITTGKQVILFRISVLCITDLEGNSTTNEDI